MIENSLEFIKSGEDLKNSINMVQYIRGMYDLSGLELLNTVKDVMTMEEFIDLCSYLKMLNTDKEIDETLRKNNIIFKI